MSLSSPVLNEMLSGLAVPPTGSLPCLDIPEGGAVLLQLVRLAYSDFHWELESLPSEVAHEVLRAARRYEMDNVVQRVRKLWMNAMVADPLKAYFVSVIYEWEEEARRSAKQLASLAVNADQVLHAYVPEMERVSALVYHNLLVYNRSYQQAFKNVVARYKTSSSRLSSSGGSPTPDQQMRPTSSVFAGASRYNGPNFGATNFGGSTIGFLVDPPRRAEEIKASQSSAVTPMVDVVEESKKLQKELADALDNLHIELHMLDSNSSRDVTTVLP